MKTIHIRLLFGLGALLALCLLAPVAGASQGHSVHLVSPLAQGEHWRHGTVPRREGYRAGYAGTSGSLMTYGGGVNDGTSVVGVTTSAPRVYLVFWGSQWGGQSTNTAGNFTYSCAGQPSGCVGDPAGVAPDLQAFFKGLGTSNETWSGVMTQYCEGIASGATSCPSSAKHVGYPTGGALAGVWEDTSAATPGSPTATQLAVEAEKAAGHFLNTSQTSNRNAQYFILSPSGTHPDGFNAGANFCAWHDFTGDGYGISLPDGWVAFTNLPYIPNAGSSCGQGFVNPGSALDGVTIVGGHEYAETITDQYPAGGWTDNVGNENGDKCAWISSGQGASADITLSTGTFAVQSTWANDTANCQIGEKPFLTGPSVANPGNQSTTVGQPATSVQMTAKEPDGTNCTTCTYAASGLPSGITMSPSGLISGTAPTTAGTSTVTVTATDGGGAQGSTSFSWAIVAGPAASLSVAPTAPSVNVGGTQLFTVTGKDQYSNTADVSQVAWTASGGGTVPAGAKGSSVTFTATSATTATVTATLGSASNAVTFTVSPAPAAGISNGGFETAALSPWTWSGQYAAVIQSTLCHGGSYCAQLGRSTPTSGDSTITQTFTAPAGTPTLSFYYKVVCPDTVTYDWATASLKDVTTGTTSTILSKTCSNTGAWVKISRTLTGAHKYTLTLTSHDDNWPGDPTYTLYDDVVTA